MLIVKLTIAILLNLSFPTTVWSYVPASPTNSTGDAIAGGLNVTDTSTFLMQWYSNGSFRDHVSHQLTANGSSGITMGAFVHFSEETVNDITLSTTTPWIALISCDANATSASKTKDIFNLAHEKGAVSALVYSLFSAACIVHASSSPIDVFASQSGTSSHLIEYQFGQLSSPLNLGPNTSALVNYDSAQLNNSAGDITKSIEARLPLTPGFLLATLNSTSPTNTNTNTTGGSSPGGSTGKLPSGTTANLNIDRNLRAVATSVMLALLFL